MSIVVSRERFEELVADALDEIPPELGGHIENLVVLVADRPSPEQQRPHPGVVLLGLYEGVPLTRRRDTALPDRITIFRHALCRTAVDEADLRDRVRRTVIHEVAHHFGIGDDRLDELGWSERSRHRHPGLESS